MAKQTRLRRVAATLALVIGAVSVPKLTTGRPQTSKPKIFAQKLVEETLTKHPEADEIGISAVSSHGCHTIASTDRGDIGEVCEKDDSEPMRTGNPYVEKEKQGFDISVPLRDSAGKIIGSVGVGFKRQAGQTETDLVAQAQKIAADMEAEVTSKAKLFERTP
jgi:hypothetical protein